jgi:hypothetical protein
MRRKTSEGWESSRVELLCGMHEALGSMSTIAKNNNKPFCNIGTLSAEKDTNNFSFFITP